MEVLKGYADVFAANPKAVAVCRGPPMRLELKDSVSVPYVAPMHHYTPEQRKLIQAEIEKYTRREQLYLRQANTPRAAAP